MKQVLISVKEYLELLNITGVDPGGLEMRGAYNAENLEILLV